MKTIDKLRLAITALDQIRQMGYDSEACRATDTVLACIRVSEETLTEIERYSRGKQSHARVMLRLKSGRYTIWAEKDGREALEIIRKRYPNLKRGRIKEVLQMWPSTIQKFRVYEDGKLC